MEKNTAANNTATQMENWNRVLIARGTAKTTVLTAVVLSTHATAATTHLRISQTNMTRRTIARCGYSSTCVLTSFFFAFEKKNPTQWTEKATLYDLRSTSGEYTHEYVQQKDWLKCSRTWSLCIHPFIDIIGMSGYQLSPWSPRCIFDNVC